MRGKDLAVLLVTDAELPDIERNVLGIIHLFPTQLEHRGGRWTLRAGTHRQAIQEPGWAAVRLVRGTPLVAMEDPNGKRVLALIDTGAFETVGIGRAAVGDYVIRSLDGREVIRHRVRRSGRARIDPRALDGHEVGVVIGMDLLRARDWRMTFNQSVWAVAPTR